MRFLPVFLQEQGIRMVIQIRNMGKGRSDIVVSDIVNGRVAVFEVKKSDALADLTSDCESALAQIDDRIVCERI